MVNLTLRQQRLNRPWIIEQTARSKVCLPLALSAPACKIVNFIQVPKALKSFRLMRSAVRILHASLMDVGGIEVIDQGTVAGSSPPHPPPPSSLPGYQYSPPLKCQTLLNNLNSFHHVYRGRFDNIITASTCRQKKCVTFECYVRYLFSCFCLLDCCLFGLV